MFKTDKYLLWFALLGFGSCSCNLQVTTGEYECTCDETDNCASSHVTGGEVDEWMNILLAKIIPHNRVLSIGKKSLWTG